MLLQCSIVCEGMHPNERLISINTNDGKLQVLVDKSIIKNDAIEVGYPVGYRDGYILVELPREAINGAWRVYVDQTELIEED